MIAITKVTYLDKELVASQLFHTLGIGTTTLEITYGQERIFVEFVISEVDDQETNKMWGQVVASDRLQIHLKNFRQLLPSQVLGPSDLGTILNRPVTIIVEVTGVKNTSCKQIAYSLYLGGASG
jgi:hypothetical protein